MTSRGRAFTTFTAFFRMVLWWLIELSISRVHDNNTEAEEQNRDDAFAIISDNGALNHDPRYATGK